jgi:hypothetical protein
MNNTVIARYNFNINSAEAEIKDDKTAYCLFRMITPLSLTQAGTQFEITVRRINIPYCFHEFNAFDETNVFRYTVGPTFSTNYSFVVQEGNYTVSELATAVITQGYNQMIANGLCSTNDKWKILYSPITNKITFYINNNTPLVTVRILQSYVAKALGFSISQDFNNNGLQATSDINVNVNPSMFVNITCDNVVQESSFQGLRGILESSTIIASIPLAENPRAYISREIQNPERIRIQNLTISELEFNLINSRGIVLQNFDLPWTMQFTIEEILVHNEEFRTNPDGAFEKNQLLIESELTGLNNNELEQIEETKQTQIRQVEELKAKLTKKRKENVLQVV